MKATSIFWEWLKRCLANKTRIGGLYVEIESLHINLSLSNVKSHCCHLNLVNVDICIWDIRIGNEDIRNSAHVTDIVYLSTLLHKPTSDRDKISNGDHVPSNKCRTTNLKSCLMYRMARQDNLQEWKFVNYWITGSYRRLHPFLPLRRKYASYHGHTPYTICTIVSLKMHYSVTRYTIYNNSVHIYICKYISTEWWLSFCFT